LEKKHTHRWIPDVLKDIEDYARLHNQPEVAALIYAARDAVSHVLGADIEASRDSGPKEEQWFGTVLDELARYCNAHGLTETEKHLLEALNTWHKALEKIEISGNVITYRF